MDVRVLLAWLFIRSKGFCLICSLMLNLYIISVMTLLSILSFSWMELALICSSTLNILLTT